MIEEIEEYAHLNHVPIMEREGIDFLVKYIEENNITSILEIGTAIGYSAIKCALVNKNIHVTTIERDKERYDIARLNIQKFKLEEQIQVILDDALNIELSEKYDLIFIDAAKAQYINFFEKFKKNLKNNGIIVSDNLKFHGLVNSNNENLSRNVKGLVRKLKNYISFLENNKEFKTTFLDIGDGVSISEKIGGNNEV